MDYDAVTQYEASHPELEKAGKTHDWCNHVDSRTRAVWSTLSPTQQHAVANDAQDAADGEVWD